MSNLAWSSNLFYSLEISLEILHQEKIGKEYSVLYTGSSSRYIISQWSSDWPALLNLKCADIASRNISFSTLQFIIGIMSIFPLISAIFVPFPSIRFLNVFISWFALLSSFLHFVALNFPVNICCPKVVQFLTLPWTELVKFKLRIFCFVFCITGLETKINLEPLFVSSMRYYNRVAPRRIFFSEVSE